MPETLENIPANANEPEPGINWGVSYVQMCNWPLCVLCMLAVSGQAISLISNLRKYHNIASAVRHLFLMLKYPSLYPVLPAEMVFWDFVSLMAQISVEKIIFKINSFLSIIISVVKTTQLTTHWHMWQVSQHGNKNQTFSCLLWYWAGFSSKNNAHRFLSRKLIFHFCYQN